MKLNKLVLLIALVALGSCGKQDINAINASKLGTKGLQVNESNIIIGELDWVSTSRLNKTGTIYRNTKFVGVVNIPAIGGRCTGFLINTNTLMTNNHCFKEAAHTVGATVVFNHEDGQGAKVSYKCDQYLGGNAELDFSLVRCANNPGSVYGFAKLSGYTYQMGPQQPIYVVQQNCDYYAERGCDYSKKIAFGNLNFQNVPVAVKADGSYVYANKAVHLADTLGGSSGSPIFSKSTNKVIALHNMGIGDTDRDGRGTYNMAVPMSQIVRMLMTRFPSIQIFTR